MIKTTAQHEKFWRERKIDWDAHYTATWTHPHRALIIAALQTIPWISLWEIGCGSGANLIRIIKEGFQGRQLGGSDINADAIAAAMKNFTGGKFHIESSEDILLSDNAVDVMLSDASLIYIGPGKIKKVIAEMTRVARNHIILCEFHSTHWWKRWLLRWRTGYNAYDYRTLLENAGCYDIKVIKIPKEFWEGDPWESFGYIIMASVTKI